MWLTTWNSHEFCPGKNIGTTLARPRWMSCDVNGCHGTSTAGRRPSRSGEVATAPAGKTTTRRLGRDGHALSRGSQIGLGRVGRAGEIDRQHVLAQFRRAQQHRIGEHEKVAATSSTSRQITMPSSTPNGWLATITSGPCAGCPRAAPLVAQVEAQPPHDRRKKPSPAAGACAVEIEPLQPRLAAGRLDRVDRGAYQRVEASA